MNKKLALLASPLFALLFSAGLACAGDLPDATVAKLMDLSGTNRQTELLPEAMKSTVDQVEQQAEGSGKPSPLSKQDFKDLKAAVGNAFAPEVLLQATAAKIKKNVSEADAKEVLAWLESDLGKKLTQAEVDASTDKARGAMMNDASSLLADKERVALAKRMDKLVHATDDAINIQLQTEVTMFVTFSKMLRPDQPVDVAAFRRRAEADVNRAQIEQYITLSYVYTYRNIDIASLKKYVEFSEHPAMQHFNDAIRDGMMEGLGKCTTQVAENIGAMMAKKKKQSS